MEFETKQLDWKVLNLDGTAGPSLKEWEGSYGLFLLFNKGCLTCKTRALPLLKQWTQYYPALKTAAVHTRLGSGTYRMEEIAVLQKEFNLNYPLFIDQETQTFNAFKGEGTPHWVLIDQNGQVIKSIFGSRPNALQRIDYFIREVYPEIQ